MTPSLAALIERVEAGGPTSLGFWREIFRPALGSPDTTLFLNFIAAVRDGSLDAAVAFTEALLPGWGWEVGHRDTWDGRICYAGVAPAHYEEPYNGDAPTPGLALVLATLRAHAAKETT